MCRKLLFFMGVFCFLFGFYGNVSADSLVAHWKLDSDANDSSGNGYDGTIYGDPCFVTGQIDGALDFDGTADYVNTNSADLDLLGTDTITVSAWIRPRTVLGDTALIINDYDKNNTLGWIVGFSTNDKLEVTNIDLTKSRKRQSSALALNQWHHVVAIIYPTGYPDIYINGQIDNNPSACGSPTTQLYMGGGNVMIGRQSNPDERYFNGLIDDVKIFDSLNPPIAHDPSPVDEGSTDADPVVLSWSSGSDAASHDVYLGTNEAAVSSAQRDIGDLHGDGLVDWFDMDVLGGQWLSSPQEPFADLDGDGDVDLLDYAIFAADWQKISDPEYKGNQINNSYTAGSLPEAVTYYWRIDEVNSLNTWKGNVWSFTTPGVVDLEISMLEPNAYEVKYDSFNVGELMYIDRTYTFTNVASLAGETYIKTANDDKYLTNEVRVVFNINQDCTVYVAFDDRISPDPAWLSDFTDTGENVSTGGDPYSLFAKDFDAGTVVLGGNSGDVSSSNYGIIVVAKGSGFIVRPEVTNDNFEYPDVSGYQYEPIGTDWSHSGNFIIADSGSAFGNTAYEGSQNMVMQGPVTLWQDVSGFEIGKTYVVRWVEADRAGGAGDNSLRVWIDDTIVGAQHTVDDENWDVIRSTEFVATSNTHTLKFETLTSGDHSAFIDAVSVSEYLSVKDWLRSRPFPIYGLNQFATDPGCNNIAQYTAAGLNNLMSWFETDKRFNYELGQAARACAGGLPWHGHIETRHTGLEGFKKAANLAGSYCGQNALLLQDEPFGNEIDVMAECAYWHKRRYPTIPIYSNNKGPQGSEDLWGDSNYPPGYDWDDYMDDFLNKVDADALMYDYYPFRDGTQTDSGWWSQLMQVRNKALAAGVPYFSWVQAWQNYNHRLPSESDLRMYIFVHLAAGYQGFGYFTYSYFGDNSMLDASDNPTALYYDVAEINPEIINLGYCLRYLTSTDVRFVPGELFAGFENSTPSGWTDWSSGAGGDTHITNVDVDHSQGGTYGSKKNGVIGFFTDDASEKYFMLTNTNHAAATDPEDSNLPFIIDFDSSVNELLELNRETGNAQVVPLTSHRLSVTLLGGCGRLYKYNTGVGFAPDVPLP